MAILKKIIENIVPCRKPNRPSFRKKSYNQKPKDIPIAALAIGVAKELLHETSESPLVLAATPSHLRKADSLRRASIKIPHYCCGNSSGTTLNSMKSFEPYPYEPLSEIADDG